MDHDITKKQFIEIILISLVLGIALFTYDFVTARVNFDGTVERNRAGSGNIVESFDLEYKDTKEEKSVEISEQRLSEKEIEDAFDKAEEELEKTYLGRNKSSDNIQYDLNIKKTYLDGLISAKWQFDDYDVISTDGQIIEENLSNAGTIVNAKVELIYEDKTRVFGFSMLVKALDMSSQEGQKYAIEKALISADEMSKGESTFILPETAGGMKLKWKRKIDYRGLELAILGVITAFALKLGSMQEKRKKQETILREKERDYPMIVSELSILMGAGMSFRKALDRMSQSYVSRVESGKSPSKAGYEEMVKTNRQLRDGLGEIAALENLSMRSNQKDYRKLAMLLSQNIKKGSAELINSLEKEEISAFSMRKQRAIRLGEEASTKLLLPMGGMLVIVMIILIAPAIMQMNI